MYDTIGFMKNISIGISTIGILHLVSIYMKCFWYITFGTYTNHDLKYIWYRL